MYKVEDILAELNKGTDPEDLAQSFVDALNDAIDKKEKVDKAAEEALVKQKEAEADIKRKARIADAWDIVDPLNEYLDEYYPGLTKGKKVTAEELVEMLDAIKEIDIFIDKLPIPAEKKKEKKTSAKIADPDKAIRAFIDSLF